MHRIIKKWRFYNIIFKLLYSRFKYILCNSYAVKKSLHKYCSKKKLKVIFNAVDQNLKIKFYTKKKNYSFCSKIRKKKKFNFFN